MGSASQSQVSICAWYSGSSQPCSAFHSSYRGSWTVFMSVMPSKPASAMHEAHFALSSAIRGSASIVSHSAFTSSDRALNSSATAPPSKISC
ncbi:hypothetical protein CHMI_03786 [Cellulomonas hominis]|nr:hypothetical protein CHMI_03786 [Cellulomonas hominis]